MWVCSVIYHTIVNDADGSKNILMIETPFTYGDDLLTLIEKLPKHTFESKYINAWIKEWMLLSDAEKEKHIHLDSTRFNIPLNTECNTVHMDFIKLSPLA